MIIQVGKFGRLLISRPAGREAFLAAKAYILAKDAKEEIVFDFKDVDVLSPSWADEFITGILSLYKDNSHKFINTINPSVRETLKILEIYQE